MNPYYTCVLSSHPHPKNHWVDLQNSACYDICVYSGYGELVFRAVLPGLGILDGLTEALPDGEYFVTITQNQKTTQGRWVVAKGLKNSA